MEDVLHQLIDRVRFHTEAEVRECHAIISEWFAEHFPASAPTSTVDTPEPATATGTSATGKVATQSD